MRKMMLKLLTSLLVCGILISARLRTHAEPQATHLTVYNQGLALVREQRRMIFESGLHPARIEEVPALLEPTSIFFKSLSHPGSVRVLEQNYDYDLVSQAKLWNKFVGKEVEVEVVDPETHKTLRKKGKLLSSGWIYGESGWVQNGSPIVEIDGKVYIQPPGQIIFPALSASEFLLRPTLSWMVDSRVSGEENVEISYITRGLSWDADYVVLLDSRDRGVDLAGWVTLRNRSGTAYRNARLQLMAGDVHLAPRNSAVLGGMREMAAKAADEAAPQFQEKSFFEYHLYTLQRPATILNDQTKQIELLNAGGIPVEKIFVYDGAPLRYGFYYDDVSSRENGSYGPQSNKKVWVMLEFANREKHGLGIPLPRGTVRVYKSDEDGSRQFVGEDWIDHTPKDEKVRLHLGDAFDVVGERKQTAFTMVVPGHVYDESFQIEVRNHKSEAVEVRVLEHLWRWNDWTITTASHKYRKLDSHTIEFPVKVGANQGQTITYTARYRW